MAYTPKENTGVLFKNNKKTDDKQPDYTGNILVGTKEMRLAAWIKEGKNGKFMSIKLSEQNSKQETSSANDGDDMPF
jgi:uncharacterized protein (DUF736 family)